MITNKTFRFLKNLKAHNDRKWFQAHRVDYDAAKAEFLGQVDHLIVGIASFDPPMIELEPADCVFRINRDTRFAKDKTPYKTHFGAFMTDRGRNVARAGYYFHVEPGGSMVAGGLYMPPAPELKAVREALVEKSDIFRRIIARKPFAKFFGKELPGARLRTAPRGYPKDHPDIDLLRLTSFEVFRELGDRDILSRTITARATEMFKAMRELIQFLNQALTENG